MWRRGCELHLVKMQRRMRDRALVPSLLVGEGQGGGYWRRSLIG